MEIRAEQFGGKTTKQLAAAQKELSGKPRGERRRGKPVPNAKKYEKPQAAKKQARTNGQRLEAQEGRFFHDGAGVKRQVYRDQQDRHVYVDRATGTPMLLIVGQPINVPAFPTMH